MSEGARNDANKVRGCVSQVWLESETRRDAAGQTTLHFRGDSDSHLVRGLVAIAIALYSDRTPKEILATDALATFREFGLEQHLTPAALQRRARDDRAHPRRRVRPRLR